MAARTGSANRVALASDALLSGDELYRMLVEGCTDTVFLIDLETEECIYVSPAVRSLLGRSPEELIGRALTDFVHPDEVVEVLARSARRREGRGLRATVTRMLHADGTPVWVQAAASPVMNYRGRSVTEFTVAGAAERVRAELGLHNARLRLRGLLDEVSGGAEHLPAHDGSYDLAVEALAAALELRDDETGLHARRVTDLALALTRVIDRQLAREPELRYGYLLHDIGKIGIPDSILLNPDHLSAQEIRTLHTHTRLGEHLVSFIPFLSDSAHDVIASHHERWDGSGYPLGLAGEDIPLAARIFAVADAFDAITHPRPYRPARSVPEAVEEIRKSAGTHFDPSIVTAFVTLVQEGHNVGSPQAPSSMSNERKHFEMDASAPSLVTSTRQRARHVPETPEGGRYGLGRW